MFTCVLKGSKRCPTRQETNAGRAGVRGGRDKCPYTNLEKRFEPQCSANRVSVLQPRTISTAQLELFGGQMVRVPHAKGFRSLAPGSLGWRNMTIPNS